MTSTTATFTSNGDENVQNTANSRNLSHVTTDLPIVDNRNTSIPSTLPQDHMRFPPSPDPTPSHSSPPSPPVPHQIPAPDRASYSVSTKLVHTENLDQYGSSSMPIYQTATFYATPQEAGKAAYDYTRSGNPTRTMLERHLRSVFECEHVFAVSTGMTAIDVILKLVHPDEEIIAGEDLYGGANRLLNFNKEYFKIKVHHVDTSSPSAVQKVINSKTRLILLETPTNPMMKVADIQEISRMAHANNGDRQVVVAVDNTMLTPILQQPLNLGADIHFESATKYFSGHHDCMAGLVAVKNTEIAQDIAWYCNAAGSSLNPNDCSLLIRSIKTLDLRLMKQAENAYRLAKFLINCGIEANFPAHRSHPQHSLHVSQTKYGGGGGVLSFRTHSVRSSERILEHVKLFQISVSFGSVNSLISMPCRMSHASIDPETRARRGLHEDVIRLCIGIEDFADLLRDIAYALSKSGLFDGAQDTVKRNLDIALEDYNQASERQLASLRD